MSAVEIADVSYSEVIRAFWKKHRIEFALDGITNLSRGRGYRVVRVGKGDVGDIVGVKIINGGRMGNVIIQMINALFFARRFGLRSVIANKPLIDESGVVVDRDGVSLYTVGNVAPSGLYIEGDFYYHDAMTNGAISPSNMEKYEIAQRYLVPILNSDRRSAEPDNKEVVIHIRSGDIFQPNPHPGYIQPPLCFYITVLSGLIEYWAIDKVCIVCEDRGNPCIDALETRVVEMDIPCRVQSGTLRDDVLCLTRAKHLVFGTGTFGAGICLLSGEVETVHSFRTNIYCGLPNVKSSMIFQADAGYIKEGEWVGSEEQRRLMIDFPISGLRKEVV